MMDRIRAWVGSRLSFWDQVVLVTIAGFVRFWRIGIPDTLVFDEVYFAVYANNYLEGISFFDSHPPLGKYLIALGIKFFGFTPFGYRCVDALFGIGVIILVYRLGTLLFNDRRIGFLAGLFAAMDGVLLVESRAGLINIFAVFFNLAAYYLFFRAGADKLKKPRWLYLIGAGLCIGGGGAVKWIGCATFGVILAVYLAAKAGQQWPRVRRMLPASDLLDRLGKVHPDLFVGTCILLPIIVYASSFIVHLNQIPDYQFFELQRQFWGYHANLKATHGYASPWWSWPILMRPVSYFWQHNQETQTVMAILNIGNPMLWWFAIPAALYGAWLALVRRHFGAAFVLFGIICHYLPFSMISRISYLYHFMGALPFMIIFLAVAVVRLWDKKGWRREIGAFVALLVVLCAIYFFPVWTALELPVGAYYQRMWFISWI